MKKDGGRNILPPMISALALIAIAIASEVLYGMTKYLPLCLFALMCFFPAVINVIVMVLRFCLPEGKCSGSSIETASVAEESIETTEPQNDDVAGSSEKTGKKKKKARKNKGSRSFIKRALCAVARWYNRNRVWIAVVLALTATVLIQIRFFVVQSRLTSLYTMNYPTLIAMIVMFTVFIALDKWGSHAKSGENFSDSLLKNLRSVFALLQIALVLMMIASALKIFGVYDAQKWLKYILMVLFYYMSVFLVVSFAVTVIKKNVFEKPFLNVPAPFAIGSSKELGLLTYFEENTGMTMRSLWSMRMVKKLFPYTIALAAMLLWFSTGLVQVESHQMGVVYRFGQLQEEALQPGLHLQLPWPCDKIEVYDVDTIQKFTVGYVSEETEDNTWTDDHGIEEYRLLLGSGDELVSINLQVEYKIGDIYQYLKNNTSPVALVEAYAYELVVDHTINNDLGTLLTIDRAAFSEDIKKDLIEGIAEYETGIEIVSVVLESIHPPIEIAEIYQNVISAEIKAVEKILEAEAYKATIIAGAQTQQTTTIASATVNQHSAIANAQAAVSEFMASVNADTSYPTTYRYYKYLNAITEAYGNTRLVIVGEGVDSSNIYFGSLNIGVIAPPETEEETTFYVEEETFSPEGK
ncbi:MAG: protease modulator HflK [Clostridia bacterium]|nr:protease modulator HflK [Clostridia bacterium]